MFLLSFNNFLWLLRQIIVKSSFPENQDRYRKRSSCSFKSSFKLTHFSHILISEKLHVDFFCSLKLKTFPLASRVPKKILLIDYRLGSKLKPNYSSTHVRYCTFNRVIVSVGRVPRYTDTVVHSHPRFTPW